MHSMLPTGSSLALPPAKSATRHLARTKDDFADERKGYSGSSKSIQRATSTGGLGAPPETTREERGRRPTRG